MNSIVKQTTRNVRVGGRAVGGRATETGTQHMSATTDCSKAEKQVRKCTHSVRIVAS
jgi:hypothetical protein